MVIGDEDGTVARSLLLLLKLLNNISKHPEEDKYRRIRRSNAKLKAEFFVDERIERQLLLTGWRAEGNNNPAPIHV